VHDIVNDDRLAHLEVITHGRNTGLVVFLVAVRVADIGYFCHKGPAGVSPGRLRLGVGSA
jgi:hypothetical protein